MKKTLFTIALCLTTSNVFAVPPQMGAGADTNSVVFKNGASEVVKINSTGTVSGAAPTANNHFATKQYVDTQTASASGGGGIMCATTDSQYNGNLGGIIGANAKCVSDFGTGWEFARGGLVANVQSIGGLTSAHSWTKTLNTDYGKSNATTCYNWTQSTASANGSFMYANGGVMQRTSGGSAARCDATKTILCCKQ